MYLVSDLYGSRRSNLQNYSTCNYLRRQEEGTRHKEPDRMSEWRKTGSKDKNTVLYSRLQGGLYLRAGFRTSPRYDQSTCVSTTRPEVPLIYSALSSFPLPSCVPFSFTHSHVLLEVKVNLDSVTRFSIEPETLW